MKFEFKPSFDRSVKGFLGKQKEEIKQTALQAIDILSQDRQIHKGIEDLNQRTPLGCAMVNVKSGVIR